MSVVPKITNKNGKNFKVAEEVWKELAATKDFDGIYNTRRNFYREKMGAPFTDDNHFRLTNNLIGNEPVFEMNDEETINLCIKIGEKGGLENFRTIQSIVWSNIGGQYYIERKGKMDRGSENLTIMLYLCGQGVVSRDELKKEIRKNGRVYK